MIALLANIWVRRALLAAALLIAFFVIRQHFINEGKTQGAADQAQRSAVDLEAQRVADRKTTEQQLGVFQQKIDASAAQAQSDRMLFLSLVSQRAAVPAQIAAMTPVQVQAQINAALGKAATAPLTYTDQDQRKFAACFDDLNLCNQQVDAKSKESVAMAEQLAGTGAQYQELGRYTSSLEQLYTQLWNDKAQPKRAPQCLWLWKCVRPKLATPDPAKLLRPTSQPVVNNK